jgi:predicted dehydrogenase
MRSKIAQVSLAQALKAIECARLSSSQVYRRIRVVEKVRVGIIGVGGIATSAHIPAYQKLADAVEIVAVCDVDEKRVKQVAEQFNVPHTFTDYTEMVAMEELDAVSVCTPPRFHAPATIAALEAGKHVLCEKPMAMNATEAKQMVEAARRSGKILTIGFQSRHAPQAKSLKTFIDAGELGQIYFARALALRRRGIPSWGVFTSKEFNGGGALIDIGVHVLDLTLWLMGHPRPTRVLGSTYDYLGKRPGYNMWGPWNYKTFDVDDAAFALVKFENGATLILETSWALNIEKDEHGPMLAGTLGGATLEPLRIYKEAHDHLLDITPMRRWPQVRPYDEEIKDFISAIRQGGEPLVKAEEALIVQQIVDAIYESSTTGDAVRIG